MGMYVVMYKDKGKFDQRIIVNVFFFGEKAYDVCYKRL